jgi:hypothetical protein
MVFCDAAIEYAIKNVLSWVRCGVDFAVKLFPSTYIYIYSFSFKTVN